MSKKIIKKIVNSKIEIKNLIKNLKTKTNYTIYFIHRYDTRNTRVLCTIESVVQTRFPTLTTIYYHLNNTNYTT
jgi:hypothetical protein